MPSFFTDSVQNSNTYFAHTLERWGNSWLQPLASFTGGKKYVRIGKENHWNVALPDDYRVKEMKKTALGIVFLVPGIVLGGLCKAASYLHSEVRSRNYAVHVVNPVTVEDTTAYHEVTRRISNRDALEIKLAACDAQAVHHLKAALDVGNWTAEIFEDQDFPYYALRLLKENQITQEQFGSVQLFWSAKKTHGSTLRIIPLFNGDAVNEDAKNKIEKTLNLHSSLAAHIAPSIARGLSFLQRGRINDYFEAMKLRPKSEHSFFFIDQDDQPDWDKNLATWGGRRYFDSHTISQEVLFSTGINALGRTEKGRMIAPIGMMQQFLETFSYGDAVKISPVIGLSTLKDIHQNGKNDTRDMAVAFPGVELPERADGFKAPGTDFAWHDFYHAIIASCMPKVDRHRMITVADAIDELRKTSWYGRYDLKQLRNRFIDMEFVMYRRDNKASDELVQRMSQCADKNDAFLWFAISSTELNHEIVEAAKWRFLASWRYNRHAYRQKIISTLTPIKKAITTARDEFAEMMNWKIILSQGFNKFKIQIIRDTHPINAYASLR